MVEKRNKILLIDDSPTDSNMIRDMLISGKGSPFDVILADRLLKGLKLLDEEEIELVILDLFLPESRGLSTLTKVYDRAPQIPIVVLTGAHDEELAIKTLRSGAEDYLLKEELNRSLLRRTIRYSIERKRDEVELRKHRVHLEELVLERTSELSRANKQLKQEITERKQMQFQLIQTEKMSALGTLVAGVSHELNNPLMGILNFSDYCLKQTTKDDRRYQFLQDIQRETERCIDIISNLLTFSRTEQDGEETYQDESLTRIIDRVVNLLSYRIKREEVSLTVHIAENTPEIRLRVNAMQQVLLNLVSNALDALVESQKKEIRIEIHPNGDVVWLTVADSGSGIAPEILDKVYDPFFTTKTAGKGTGLGLSISRSIIESHGGDITCKSNWGKGTTFNILLPTGRKGKEDAK